LIFKSELSQTRSPRYQRDHNILYQGYKLKFSEPDKTILNLHINSSHTNLMQIRILVCIIKINSRISILHINSSRTSSSCIRISVLNINFKQDFYSKPGDRESIGAGFQLSISSNISKTRRKVKVSFIFI
jgi:hypothetical protein